MLLLLRVLLVLLWPAAKWHNVCCYFRTVNLPSAAIFTLLFCCDALATVP
jgi:hypothetical protein